MLLTKKGIPNKLTIWLIPVDTVDTADTVDTVDTVDGANLDSLGGAKPYGYTSPINIDMVCL